MCWLRRRAMRATGCLPWRNITAFGLCFYSAFRIAGHERARPPKQIQPEAQSISPMVITHCAARKSLTAGYEASGCSVLTSLRMRGGGGGEIGRRERTQERKAQRQLDGDHCNMRRPPIKNEGRFSLLTYSSIHSTNGGRDWEELEWAEERRAPAAAQVQRCQVRHMSIAKHNKRRKTSGKRIAAFEAQRWTPAAQH